jgi:glucokinase
MFLENRSRMVGIDIGGSHITVSLIDLENQCVISESVIRSKVDTHGSANEILNTWVSTIKRVLGNYQIDHVKMGIAMLGPFDYENETSFIKPLFNRISRGERLGISSVWIPSAPSS